MQQTEFAAFEQLAHGETGLDFQLQKARSTIVLDICGNKYSGIVTRAKRLQRCEHPLPACCGHCRSGKIARTTARTVWWNSRKIPSLETFQATVATHPGLSPVLKMTYLRSFLRVKALEVVRGYALVPENYDVVLHELIERFGNNQELILELETELLTLQPTIDQNPSNLRLVCNHCTRLIRRSPFWKLSHQ